MNFKKLILVVLVTTSFFSCKKDDDTTPTPTPKDTSEYFRCKLNNTDFIDDSRFADFTNNSTRVISQNDQELIRLNIGGESAGTYTISANNTNNGIIYVDGSGIQYNAISGSIIVTEYNKTDQIISGTFTGVLKKTTDNTQITLTDGKFNYIELLPF